MSTRIRPRLRIQPRRPRGRPKAEHVEAIEARLILVARQAFIAHGYGATSINAIAKSARVSKNTFYARFPSKGDVFRAIVERQIAMVDGEFLPTSAGTDTSLEDTLRSYVNIALKRSLSGDALEINRLIMSEAYQFPELGEAARGRFLIGVEHVAKLIEECAQRDRCPCKDPAAAAELLLAAALGWYNFVMITNRAVSDKERALWVDKVIRVFIAGRSAW